MDPKRVRLDDAVLDYIRREVEGSSARKLAPQMGLKRQNLDEIVADPPTRVIHLRHLEALAESRDKTASEFLFELAKFAAGMELARVREGSVTDEATASRLSEERSQPPTPQRR